MDMIKLISYLVEEMLILVIKFLSLLDDGKDRK